MSSGYRTRPSKTSQPKFTSSSEPPPRQPVHLLEPALADVADPEVAGLAVEREPPGIAQAVGDNLGSRLGRVHVEGEELAQPLREILSAILGIAARTAVAQAEPEPAVGREGELAAIVVRIRLFLREEHAGGGLVHAASILPRPVLDHARVALDVGVVDVEERVGLVARMEREPEETLLAPRHHLVGDVEEALAATRPPSTTAIRPTARRRRGGRARRRPGRVERGLEAGRDAHQPSRSGFAGSGLRVRLGRLGLGGLGLGGLGRRNGLGGAGRPSSESPAQPPRTSAAQPEARRRLSARIVQP